MRYAIIPHRTLQYQQIRRPQPIPINLRAPISRLWRHLLYLPLFRLTSGLLLQVTRRLHFLLGFGCVCLDLAHGFLALVAQALCRAISTKKNPLLLHPDHVAGAMAAACG